VVKVPVTEKKKEPLAQDLEKEGKTEPKVETVKEVPKKSKTKREISLYHKMFGTRKA